MILPRTFSLLLLLAAGLRAGEVKVVPPEEQAAVAHRVREIFEAKCKQCHGPELPRPKGKFGYVLDLKRMADNPDYVVRGDPDKSEIYTMVRDDEMPGEDADVPALSMEEKDIVKRWVEMGAPADPATAAEKEPAAPAPVPQKTTRPFWEQALRWIGKFHPVTTHFPVALMMVAVLAEGLAWWTRRESWMHTIRFIVVIAALGALSSGVLGWINAYFSSYSKTVGALLWWHRWFGTATTLWAVVCAGLAFLGPCVEGTAERRRFRGALLLGAALVSVTGFLGSALIYGLEHYAW